MILFYSFMYLFLLQLKFSLCILMNNLGMLLDFWWDICAAYSRFRRHFCYIPKKCMFTPQHAAAVPLSLIIYIAPSTKGRRVLAQTCFPKVQLYISFPPTVPPSDHWPIGDAMLLWLDQWYCSWLTYGHIFLAPSVFYAHFQCAIMAAVEYFR